MYMTSFIRFTANDGHIEEVAVDMTAEDARRLVMAGVGVTTAYGQTIPSTAVMHVYDVYDVVAITIAQIWRNLPPELGDGEVCRFRRLLAAIAEEAGREWFATDGCAVHVPRTGASWTWHEAQPAGED